MLKKHISPYVSVHTTLLVAMMPMLAPGCSAYDHAALASLTSESIEDTQSDLILPNEGAVPSQRTGIFSAGTKKLLAVPFQWNASSRKNTRDYSSLNRALKDDPNSLRAFYSKVSYGKLDFDVTVVEETVILNQEVPISCTNSDYYSWTDSVIQWVQTQDRYKGDYDFIMLFLPPDTTCRNNKGTSYGRDSWIISSADLWVVPYHEIGHCLGFGHAGQLYCAGRPLPGSLPGIASCTASDYGDNTDIMGDNIAAYEPNALHRFGLGWLEKSQVLTLDENSITGQFRLSSLEGVHDGIRMLRFRHPVLNEWMSISYRSGASVFDSVPSFNKGTYIHMEWTRASNIVDTGDTWLLRSGGTDSYIASNGDFFYDPLSGLMVTQIAQSENDVTLDIKRLAQRNSLPVISTSGH